MNISDFISESIIGVVEGVKAASEALKEQNVKLNPPMDSGGFIQTDGTRSITPKQLKVQSIEMSIAVTTSDQSSGVSGKAGVSVLGFNAGLDTGGNTTLNSTVSNIKFSVPIAFPQG